MSGSAQSPAGVASAIRAYRESDWRAVLPILQETFRAGDTYAFSPQSTEEEIRRVWIEAPAGTFVADDGGGRIQGTYNHQQLGYVDALVMFKQLV